jgi:predicted glycoside hydrolase/deacetylase ChbG (UPF0249 family)
MTRALVVNADDLGRSQGINRGIAAAHEHGIVTSASLMVRWPATPEGAAYAGGHSDLSLGLHIDLAEWVYRDGVWEAVYEVVPVDDRARVEVEVGRQLTAFRELTGNDPTHLDSHQHVHRQEPVRSVLVDIAREVDVPLRLVSSNVGYCGEFYGQTARGESVPEAITIESLVAIVEALPEGTTELGCHPAEANDVDSVYGAERQIELRTLCDPRIRTALSELGIQLRAFHGMSYSASVQPR